jgi:hypothetical protein
MGPQGPIGPAAPPPPPPPPPPTNDDRRAAVLIAVDAAKGLITIGVAFFAALGAFALNYRSNHTIFLTAWPILLMAVSAVVTVISMVVGLAAIGRAYKRGQRPPDPSGEPSWSTKPISGLLGWQSVLGLLALALFAGSIVMWEQQPAPADSRLDRAEASLSALSGRLDQQERTLATAITDIANLPQARLTDPISQGVRDQAKLIDAQNQLVTNQNQLIKNLSEQVKSLTDVIKNQQTTQRTRPTPTVGGNAPPPSRSNQPRNATGKRQ